MGIVADRWLCPLFVGCVLPLYYWNMIDKQSDHDSNRSIGNPVEAKSQGAFIASVCHRYAKKYNAHQECSFFLLYKYRKVNKWDKQN